jgi:hypothetical protein
VENLCKDIFLRRQMNTHGFVPLPVFLNFPRVRAMGVDPVTARMVCQQSPQIELLFDPEGKEYVRKALHWEQWVLPQEQRLAYAKGDGPPLYSWLPPPQVPYDPRAYGMPPQTNFQPQPYMAASFPNGVMAPPADMNYMSQPPDGMYNHHSQMDTSAGHHHHVPLSATVPEFTPRYAANEPFVQQFSAMIQDHTAPPETQNYDETMPSENKFANGTKSPSKANKKTQPVPEQPRESAKSPPAPEMATPSVETATNGDDATTVQETNKGV